MLERLAWIVNRAAGALAALLLVYILGHIVVEIVLRVFFHRSTYVLDEFVGYAVAAMTFLSLGYTLDTGSLIRVELLIGRFPGRPRRWAEMLCVLATFAVTGFCAYWVGRDALRNWHRGAVSESIAEVPLWLPVGAVWLGLVLFMLQLLVYFIRLARGGGPVGSEQEE